MERSICEFKICRRADNYERKSNMFPTINLREIGINLRRIMDKRGIAPKDIKKFLNLGSIQTVFNGCNGLNSPREIFNCSIPDVLIVLRKFHFLFVTSIAYGIVP